MSAYNCNRNEQLDRNPSTSNEVLNQLAATLCPYHNHQGNTIVFSKRSRFPLEIDISIFLFLMGKRTGHLDN